MHSVEAARDYHAWTHACLDTLLNHLATVPTGVCHVELEGFGFTTIHAQLVHILCCEHAWVAALNLTDARPAEPITSLGDVVRYKREVRHTTQAYLERLSHQRFHLPCAIELEGNEPVEASPARVVHHVLTHAFHHKGQIVAMCRWLGYPAPMTDVLPGSHAPPLPRSRPSQEKD